MAAIMAYPRIIAHRCGGAGAPENSLAGLALAARLGCRGVEFDTMLSADDVPVLMHDDTVDRTTNGRGPVAALTAAELRRLDLGGEPVPLLAEALECCARLGLWANVEIKASANATGGGDERLGRIVGKVLAERWNGHGVISSFSFAALKAARAQAPHFAHALLSSTLPTDWLAKAREVGAIAVHLNAKRITAENIAAVRAAGLTLACYTVNERRRADDLFASGVDAVFTDRPELWTPAEM